MYLTTCPNILGNECSFGIVEIEIILDAILILFLRSTYSQCADPTDFVLSKIFVILLCERIVGDINEIRNVFLLPPGASWKYMLPV